MIVYIWKNHFPAGTNNKLKDKKYRPFQMMKHINNNAYVVRLQPEMCISSAFNVVKLFESSSLALDESNNENLRHSSSQVGVLILNEWYKKLSLNKDFITH